MIQGYFTHSGYMGLTEDGWILFATEDDYADYLLETDMLRNLERRELE